MIEITVSAVDKSAQTLECVEANMTKKYPPDWLEMYGGRIYQLLLVTCFAVYLLMSWSQGPWPSLFIPLLIPPVVAYIPDLLVARRPGRPRWAHHLAVVDPADVEAVHGIIMAAPPAYRVEAVSYYPATTGDRAYEVLKMHRYHNTSTRHCGHLL